MRRAATCASTSTAGASASACTSIRSRPAATRPGPPRRRRCSPATWRTRIAFAVQRGRDRELYVMNLDGTGLHPLTDDHSIAMSPAWSPEGSLLLFTSYRGGGGPRIWVIPSAGGRPYLISGRHGNNISASYSPDGRDVACSLSMDGNAEIYLLD